MKRHHEKNSAPGISLACPMGVLAVAMALAAGCRSVPEGYAPAPEGNPLAVALGQMERGCALGRGDGGFLALLSAEGVPAMRFEGAWSSGFSQLRAEVLSPLGEALATLSLVDEGNESRVEVSGADTPAVQGIAGFLQQLGSRNLRLLSCGLHMRGKLFSAAFRTPEGMSFFHNYLSRGKLSARGSTLDVASEVLALRRGAETSLNARSRFSGGFFSKTEVGLVEWEGSVSPESFSPQKVRALFSDASFTLIFSEFD